jgi:hypothetical protein
MTQRELEDLGYVFDLRALDSSRWLRVTAPDGWTYENVPFSNVYEAATKHFEQMSMNKAMLADMRLIVKQAELGLEKRIPASQALAAVRGLAKEYATDV